MARRESKKAPQPPFILLDHNVNVDVAKELSRLAHFRQVGERERDWRFRRDAKAPEIHRGPRRFLFVTRDQDFLRQDRLPSAHGGILVFVCPPQSLAPALRRFLRGWGPRRNLLRNRVFRVTETSGREVLRDGTISYIHRNPAERRDAAYGSSERTASE